jgi:hypothetical protein
MTDRRAIEIDFDIHKRIEAARRSFSESDIIVLRRLLKIDPDDAAPPKANGHAGTGREWFGDGATLPHGTEVRMKYNGRLHTGQIDNGDWLVEGSRYNSPSAAAGGVGRTKKGGKTSLDGWLYWEAKRPGDREWVPIKSLRRH